jgi:hypothetical protein
MYINSYEPSSQGSAIAFVSLKQIELDIVMQNTLGIYGVDLTKFKLRTRVPVANKDGILPRITPMLLGMGTRDKLPPINVKIHQRGGGMTMVLPSHRKRGIKPKPIPVEMSYSIDNGRHRVVASIILIIHKT